MTGDNPFLEIIGGLFLVLYGIHLSGINLQKILGSNIEKALKKTNNNPIRGVAIGTGITSLIHSSGTTTVMLIGLITGGFMGLEGAIPVMLGANIGSTIATQLASMRIGSYALIFLALGVYIHIAVTKKIHKRVGEALIGFSFLFLGMDFIFKGVSFLSKNEIFVSVITSMTQSPAAGIVSGAFATVILSSASAAAILIVALGIASVINLRTALFIILGINLGSSLKITYRVLKGDNLSGKLALIHLVFNCFGIAVFLLFFDAFYQIAELTSGDTGRQIANAHTFYNIIAALIFIPFTPLVIKVIEKILPSDKSIKKHTLFYLDKKLICTPSVSLQQVNRGTVEMAKISYNMLESSRKIFFEDRTDLLKKVEADENKIDQMTEKISEYMVQISQQNLSRENAMTLYSLMHIVADIEHLCDHIFSTSQIFVNLKNDRKVNFSEKACDELTAVYGKLKIMQNLIIKSLDENNLKLANEIAEHENKVDEIIKKITANHINRIKEGKCTEDAGKYFMNALYHLERVGDHYDNIAYAIIDRSRIE